VATVDLDIDLLRHFCRRSYLAFQPPGVLNIQLK
jgi:hypothetical protein